jgi:hypothetical protein
MKLMSNDDNRPESQGENSPTGSYDVGYGKPPKEFQFKPGNKANQRGRPKGSRNRKAVIEEVLFEPISVREGDKIRKIPVLEAIIKKMANKALMGDNKAAFTIVGLAQKEGLLTPAQDEMVEDNLSETDKAILADFARRISAPEA